MPRAATIPRIFDGETFVVIASGPSLNLRQVAAVYRARVSENCAAIVVNDSYQAAPWADVLYACDYKWWEHHKPWVKYFGGICYSCMPEVAIAWQRVHWIPFQDAPGLSSDPEIIHSGCNSGYQAVNLAALMGAQKIVLLGFDHTCNGQKHWFGNHPGNLNKYSDYHRWIADAWATVPVSAGKMGIDIVNCTPGSLLDMFRQNSLEAEL